MSEMSIWNWNWGLPGADTGSPVTVENSPDSRQGIASMLMLGTSQIPNEYCGIGVTLDCEVPSGAWKIKQVLEHLCIDTTRNNGQSSETRLKYSDKLFPGDEIIEVDQQRVTGLTAAEFGKLVMGPEGSAVCLSIRRVARIKKKSIEVLQNEQAMRREREARQTLIGPVDSPTSKADEGQRPTSPPTAATLVHPSTADECQPALGTAAAAAGGDSKVTSPAAAGGDENLCVWVVRSRRTKHYPHPYSASAEGLAAVFRLLDPNSPRPAAKHAPESPPCMTRSPSP